MIDKNINNNIFRYNIEINNYYNDANKTINDVEYNYVNTITLDTINYNNILTIVCLDIHIGKYI